MEDGDKVLLEKTAVSLPILEATRGRPGGNMVEAASGVEILLGAEEEGTGAAKTVAEAEGIILDFLSSRVKPAFTETSFNSIVFLSFMDSAIEASAD